MNSRNETDFEQLPSDLMLKINQLCDQFESELKQGNLPSINAYLDDIAVEYRDVILKELIPLEVEHRFEHGEQPDSSEYLTQFPALDQEWVLTVIRKTRAESNTVSANKKRNGNQNKTSELSFEQYVSQVTESGIISQRNLTELIEDCDKTQKPKTIVDLSEFLVQKGKLTKYQANALSSAEDQPLLIGDYLIQEPIGSGGMGTVYKAIHQRMKRVVALKVIRSDMNQVPDRLKRFEREVQTAARLSHPHIVTAYDAGEEHGVHYLICEYIDGESLTELVRGSGPLDFSDAINCILQVARGLEYAHGQGVIHRDIKPANILVDDQGDLKILDMGLARLQQSSEDLLANGSQTELTTSQFFMGTIDYMAPEQARNTKLADHRSDIYSLGCTLYFLLTAKPVYEGETTVERILAHKEQPIPSLSALGRQVPTEFDPIFTKMLAKEPDDRYNNVTELISDLNKFSVDYLQDQTFTLPVVDGKQNAVSHDNWASAPTEIQPAVSDLTVLGKASSQGKQKNNTATQKKLLWGGIATAVVVLIGILFWNRPNQSSLSSESDLSITGLPPASPFTPPEAKQYQQEYAQKVKLPVIEHVSLGDHGKEQQLELTLIPPGKFKMRNPSQSLTNGAGDAYFVKLTKPYYMSSTEITTGLYRIFVNETKYQTDAERNSRGGYGMEGGSWRQSSDYSWKYVGELEIKNQMPALSISWNDAVAFCKWLSDKTGHRYRLPTEAEWEYACRAGTQSDWFFGTDSGELENYAWFRNNSENRIHSVKKKLPNAFGLYDVYGNEWEWCQDYYSEDYIAESDRVDPTGPEQGSGRVRRGGGFGQSSDQLTSYARENGNPESPYHGSFRIVRELKLD